MVTAMEVAFEREALVYPLLKLLIQYGGDPRIAIESDGCHGGLILKTLLNGIQFDLKPNHIGRDGETDLTRELKELWFWFIPVKDIVNSFVMMKKAGADFNIANRAGNYPINLAIYSAIHDSHCQSIPESSKEDKLSLAILEFLLKSGADLSVENSDKRTVIMQSIPDVYSQINTKEAIGHTKTVIELLIKNGASVCQKSSEGLTAFDVAASEFPKILPWLRKLIDREPENLCEAILFRGQKSLVLLDEDITKSSDEEKIKGLAYAMRLKYVDVVNYLLSQDIDVLKATNEFKTVTQVKRKSETYPLTFLKFLAKSDHPKLEVVWREILKIDARDKAKDIARQQLENSLGESKVTSLVETAEKDAEKAKANFKQRTKEFTDKLKQLRSYLMEHGVFAFDVYNHGYAPSEGGGYVLEAIDDAVSCGELSHDDIQDLKYCWYDLQHAKDEAKQDPLGFGPMLEAVDSIYIYFDGETRKEKDSAAKIILEAAKQVELEAAWNGDVDIAILLSMASIEVGSANGQ